MAVELRPLHEQVILITGASSGIGLVTAKEAATRGAKVMLVARNEKSLQRAVDEITRKGGIAEFCIADVGKLEAIRDAAQRTIERFGRIDTWVNNAGAVIYAKLIDTPFAEHQRLFQTNYFGAVNGSLTAVEHMSSSGGAIITIGSIASDLPSPILSAYSASKHAIKAFVDSLRMELEADRLPISVTLVKPAGVNTPIARHAASHIDNEAVIPLPIYDPLVVADAILDAAQHARRNITVGGLGRLQVLLGTHFPAVLDKMAPLLIRMMSDPSRPKTQSDSLFLPSNIEQERSGVQSGRKISFYALFQRHPAATRAAAMGLIVGLTLFTKWWQRQGRSQRHLG